MNSATKFDFSNAKNNVHKTYDELLLPRIFVPLAQSTLAEADIFQGGHILDLACGPGTISRLAAKEAGVNGRVLALDISSAMLQVAKSKPPFANSASIEYKESPASPLSFSENFFDRTICQQGLQFFPNRRESLKEMVRVTKPGGKIIIAVWGPLESCTIFHKLYLGMLESIPRDIAELLDAPFSFHSEDEIKTLADSVGIKNFQIKSVKLPLIFEQGVDQAIKILEATPFHSQIKELPENVQTELSLSLHANLKPLLQDGEIHGQMISRIISIEV